MDLLCCVPMSLLRNMEREADVTSSLRHLRLNSGDMNTIFVSGARKLNGQTAAIGEYVLYTFISKFSALLIEVSPVYSINFHCNSISL